MTPAPIAELRLSHVFARMVTAWAGRWLAGRADQHLAQGLPGLAVFSFDHVGRQVAMWGRYEREELELLMRGLQPELKFDGAVLDIGANVGNHALFFAEHFGDVLAFEPNPRTHALLAINAQLRANLRCFDFGLSDAAGEAVLTVAPANLGMATLQPGATGEQVRCRLERLDDLPDLAGRKVVLMKIDVEGHEVQVLRGARGLLARDRPVVVLEQAASEVKGGSTAALALLRDAGYTRVWTMERFPDGRSRWLNLLRRALFGEGLRLVPCERLAPRFHSMIAVLP